jgi:hypothetical protein
MTLVNAVLAGPKGVRAVWRFALFVFLIFGLSKLFFWLLTILFLHEERAGWLPTDLLLESGLSFAAALSAAFIMSKIERRPFREYGLTRQGMFGRQFWQGILWALAASSVMVLVLSLLGAASFGGMALPGRPLVGSALLWASAFLLLAFAEEFAYRGYAQATLADGMGFWPAAIVLSALFGAVHYFFKPMENWMDGIGVGLLGLFWCFSVRRTGNLWFAVGFHTMTNYADMVLLAQPNTGNGGQSLTGHLLNVTYRGPDWLTGGPRGTEASVLVFPILAVLFLALARGYPRR